MDGKVWGVPRPPKSVGRMALRNAERALGIGAIFYSLEDVFQSWLQYRAEQCPGVDGPQASMKRALCGSQHHTGGQVQMSEPHQK